MLINNNTRINSVSPTQNCKPTLPHPVGDHVKLHMKTCQAFCDLVSANISSLISCQPLLTLSLTVLKPDHAVLYPLALLMLFYLCSFLLLYLANSHSRWEIQLRYPSEHVSLWTSQLVKCTLSSFLGSSVHNFKIVFS